MSLVGRLAFIGIVAVIFWAGVQAIAQDAPHPERLVTEAIDETRLTHLTNNTPAAANAQNDQGALDDAAPMSNMLVQLHRSTAQEQALMQLIDQLHDRASPNYGKWLTPDQFGAQFGPDQADIDAVTGWLEQHGFTINGIYPNRMVIDFSGTAGQVKAAFRTEIHHLLVNGQPHFANMSDPSIPAALAPAVAGIIHLHDFQPHHQSKTRPMYSQTGYGAAVAPADLATIYNLTPLFAAGNSGQGQTIYVVEDSDLYSSGDWTQFRTMFGLSSYTATLTTVHPQPQSGRSNCSDPGASQTDEGEAIIDTEWASAAAPSANIVVSSCTNLDVAYQNLINAASPPALISISYGNCESDNGAAYNAEIYSAFQQGVTEGISIFVSAGDNGPAGCDVGNNATQGINISGYASTPFAVAVGGTSFGDTYAGTTSTYWSSRNSVALGSALSYVPELIWNDSCANPLLAQYLGYSTTYGQGGLCNSSYAQKNDLVTLSGGSGGPSACAYGRASVMDVVSGSCSGYAKPSWQSVLGNPADGVRDIPDVSLFSGGAAWGNGYLFCDSMQKGQGCSNGVNGYLGFGTSYSSPIMAGIQALINQSQGGAAQGNPNYVYYKLAAAEYGTSGNASCTSSLGKGAASSCIFYDVTLGNTAQPCTSTLNCYQPSGTNGVLSSSDNSYQPVYAAGAGWDFATGIGSVNAYNLVKNWSGTTVTSLAVVPQNGWWWNPVQGGTGYSIEVSPTDGSIYMAAYLYAATGEAIWYTGTLTTSGSSVYSGSLTEYQGGQTLNGTYHAVASSSAIATVQLVVSSNTAATLSVTGAGLNPTNINVQRYAFVTNGLSSPPTAAEPQTGWWWNPAEGGRGYFLEVQNNTAFFAAYMYDTGGNPVWYVAPPTALTTPTSFTGTLQQYGNGMTLGGTYTAATIANSDVGTASMRFSSPTAGTMTLPDGTPIPIQRYTF